MGARLFRGYLVGQALAIATLLFTPLEGWLHVGVRLGAGCAGAAAAVAGTRRHRPPGATAYYLFGLGVLMNVVGVFVEKLLATLEPEVSPPSLAELFWLATYPALFAGIAVLIRRRGSGGDWTAAVDTGIVTAGLGLLCWVFLIRPQASHADTTLLGRAVIVAYPLADLLGLALMVRLLIGGGGRIAAFRLLIAALVALLGSDLAWAILGQVGVNPGPLAARLLAMNYQAAYALFGAAALHPSVSELARPVLRAERVRPGLLAGLAAAALVAPALLFVEHRRGQVVDGLAIAVSSAVLFLLVVARLALVLRRLAERNRAVRLVLDTVNEGLLRVASDGTMAEERSAAVDRWLGAFAGGASLVEHVARVDPAFAGLFRVGHEALREGVMPAELCLEQLPRRLRAAGRALDVAYLPMGDAAGLLLVLTDVTERLQHAEQEAEQRELLAVSQGLARDRIGLLALFDDVTRLLGQITSGAEEPATQRRLLHTLKGNTSLAGLDVLAQLCHAAEEELAEAAPEPAPRPALQRLRARWETLGQTLRELLGGRGLDIVELPRRELVQLGAELGGGLPVAQAIERLSSWRCEPVLRPLSRLAGHARALARRMGKGDLDVEVQAGDLRLDSERWRPLWSELVHLVNNAVDHGLEPAEERRAAGKPARPRLRLGAQIRGSALVIEIEDDGRGVDWEAIRRAAEARGLPAATQKDLTAALLAAGVSSRAQVDLVSGRGVGTAAVAARTRELAGELGVTSRPGAGTCWRLSFPLSAAAPQAASSLRSTASSM